MTTMIYLAIHHHSSGSDHWVISLLWFPYSSSLLLSYFFFSFSQLTITVKVSPFKGQQGIIELYFLHFDCRWNPRLLAVRYQLPRSLRPRPKLLWRNTRGCCQGILFNEISQRRMCSVLRFEIFVIQSNLISEKASRYLFASRPKCLIQRVLRAVIEQREHHSAACWELCHFRLGFNLRKQQEHVSFRFILS